MQRSTFAVASNSDADDLADYRLLIPQEELRQLVQREMEEFENSEK